MEVLQIGAWSHNIVPLKEGFWIRLHRYDMDTKAQERWILTDNGWKLFKKGETFHIGTEVYTISEENAKEIYLQLKKYFNG